MSIRFDNQVAIVTGAGNGLGKSHVLELARRGAKVVINDIGGDVHGIGNSSEPANQVAQMIIQNGGDAIVDNADVSNKEHVQAMIDRTMQKWGRIDILINNAGILLDKSFAKMTVEEFHKVLHVHQLGSAICTLAVWNIMREQKYGRILMTSSPSALGNFGQANYSSAKAGLIGLTNTLKLEGEKYNIRVNAILPAATTRMTADLIPESIAQLWRPEYVTAGVIYLVSDSAPNGALVSCAGGNFSLIKMCSTEGISFSPENITPENVLASWNKISDASVLKVFESNKDLSTDQTPKIAQAFGIVL